LNNRLARPLAQVTDNAFFAQRPARDTSVAPVQDKPMVSVLFVLGRDHLLQFRFDIEWGLAGRQAGAVADAEYMGVDRDRWLAEGNVENNIRGLAADTRQSLQLVARARDLPRMFGNEFLRQRDDILRLVAEQADGLDQIAHFIFAERGHFFRR